MKASVIGATGYAGVELLRLLDGHPEAEIAAITSESSTGEAIAAMYPHLAGRIDKKLESMQQLEEIAAVSDVIFIALPHGHAMKLGKRLRGSDVKIIDLGGTFGGNPLACAAVYATLTTLRSEGLVDKVAAKGEYFISELRKLQEKYSDKVTEVRGRGLLLGMEVKGEGKPLVEACLTEHVIVNCTAGNVIRIVPPLIISKEEIDIVVAALDKALAACLN